MAGKLRREEIYLFLGDAAQLTGFRCSKLHYLVRHGFLTQYRTAGNHRRYAVSALRAPKDQLAKSRHQKPLMPFK